MGKTHRIRKTLIISPEHDQMITEMAKAQRRKRVDIIEIAVEKLYQEHQ